MNQSRGGVKDATPKKVSPRRGGAAPKDELTRSFNPGLKNAQTPRSTGLKFNPAGSSAASGADNSGGA